MNSNIFITAKHNTGAIVWHRLKEKVSDFKAIANCGEIFEPPFEYIERDTPGPRKCSWCFPEKRPFAIPNFDDLVSTESLAVL